MDTLNLHNKHILVTGGTGFIGGRLVEELVTRHGAHVRVLVRNFAHAARIARFPIEMIPGNVVEPADVSRAMQGCEIVFHCAYGTMGDAAAQRRVNVEGTRNVLDAALAANASRVVSLSTLSVYGDLPDGLLDETAPRRRSKDVYADSKLEAENLALDYAKHRGLPVIVLQPTMVYGPFAPSWTIRILNDLHTHRVILINGGAGHCHPLYIDDLVHAMLRAAVTGQGLGEHYLISGENPVTWQEFYARYEAMLGFNSTISLTADEALAHYRGTFRRKPLLRTTLNLLRGDRQLRWQIEATREVNALLRLTRALLPQKSRRTLKTGLSLKDTPGQQAAASTLASSAPPRPILPLDPAGIALARSKTTVSIEKARRLLSYQPQIDFAAGADRTERWARWANLPGSGDAAP